MTTHDLTLLLTVGGILIALFWFVVNTVLGLTAFFRTGKLTDISPELTKRLEALEADREQMALLETGFQTAPQELKTGINFVLETLTSVVEVYPAPVLKELILFLDDLRRPGVPADPSATKEALAQMPSVMANKDAK